MGSPSPTINPLTSSNSWMYFTLNGVPSPGVIIKGGFKGFLRETGWDEQKGKGTAGATLVLKTMPPSKGSFTLGLFRALNQLAILGAGGLSRANNLAFGNPRNPSYPGVDDFGNWDTFVEQVLALGAKEQQANGLAIYYPGLSSVGIGKVVVKDYSPPIYAGRGMYHVTINLIEWTPPPPVSIVKVVQKSAPALPPPGSGFAVDSERNIQDRNTVNKLRGAAVP